MRAIQFTRNEAPLEDYMILNENVESPKTTALKPGTGQVLVEVYSAAINPADYKFLEMRFAGRQMKKAPAIPGQDLAGKVVAIGGTRPDLKVGDLCFGKASIFGPYGSLGEYVVAPADSIAALPPGVDVDQAAACGVGVATAWRAIHPYIKDKANARVFINGGSGGVGTYAIQIAKNLGAHVTATCSAGNVQLCKDLGADQVIDYTSEDVVKVLARDGEVYDLCVDLVARNDALYKRAHEYMKSDAMYAQVAGDITVKAVTQVIRRGYLPSMFSDGKRRWEFIASPPGKDALEQAAAWMAQGKMRSVIDSKYDLSATAEAFRKLRTNRAKGKIVIKVRDPKS